MNHPRRAFTMVELMVAAACFLLIFLPALKIWRSGTTQSVRGMLQLETSQEGQRILRQLHEDLRMACLPFPDQPDLLTFADLLQSSASPRTYTWLRFPSHGTVEEAFESRENPKTLPTRITWRLQPNPKTPILSELWRDEEFMAPSPWAAKFPQGRRHRLSDRVNGGNFRITGEFLPADRPRFCFRIMLQLVDSTNRESALAAAATAPDFDERSAGVVVGDFFDLVAPEWFQSWYDEQYVNRAWHAGVKPFPETN